MTNEMNNRNVEALFNKYKPLILRVYKRFHPMFSNKQDKEDLLSEMRLIFYKLILEYDPSRGVDLPYYLKRMLEWRTFHYITKQLKIKNRETLVESLTYGKVNYEEDLENLEEIQRLIEVLSWDDDFSLGRKQKELFISILKHEKTPQQIAEEEGVDVSTIHTRFHFLLKKIEKQKQLQEKREQED